MSAVRNSDLRLVAVGIVYGGWWILLGMVIVCSACCGDG